MGWSGFVDKAAVEPLGIGISRGFSRKLLFLGDGTTGPSRADLTPTNAKAVSVGDPELRPLLTTIFRGWEVSRAA